MVPRGGGLGREPGRVRPLEPSRPTPDLRSRHGERARRRSRGGPAFRSSSSPEVGVTRATGQVLGGGRVPARSRPLAPPRGAEHRRGGRRPRARVGPRRDQVGAGSVCVMRAGAGRSPNGRRSPRATLSPRGGPVSDETRAETNLVHRRGFRRHSREANHGLRAGALEAGAMATGRSTGGHFAGGPMTPQTPARSGAPRELWKENMA